MNKPKIFIAGAGGIGRAVGLILREMGYLQPDLILGDLNFEVAQAACNWITAHSDKPGEVTPEEMPREGSNSYLHEALAPCDILLDCLPGSQAPRMARLAVEHNLHYANLTEYVAETNEIMEIAKDAKTGFILQTGLAPGFVGVLAHGLFQQFCADFGVETADEVLMRVGALTKNAAPPHFYGFTWSPVGVATEYVKPAVVIREGGKTKVDSLSERALRIIDHKTFEEDLTSGGAADLPDALAGKVKTLDYKTLRYPGHYAWVDSLLARMKGVEDKAAVLETLMLEAIPSHEEDLVVVFASVTGKDKNGRLQTREAEYFLYPMTIGGQRLRAIQTTTAAPLAQCAAMLATGKYAGVVLQSQLDSGEFLGGAYVKAVYG